MSTAESSHVPPYQPESSRVPLYQPVRSEPTPAEKNGAEKGIAVCLSGGGFRAMLFHVGSLLRLNEAGVLARVSRVSSVSGGSITAAVLGMNWKSLDFSSGKASDQPMRAHLVDPISRLANHTIDIPSVGVGLLFPGMTISDRVAAAYDKHLFHGATLQALPNDAAKEGPRFVINATSVQTGSLWRFSRPYMGDYRVGLWCQPEIPLAIAVTASSAFPPFLSPCFLEMDQAPCPIPAGQPLPPCRQPPYTTHVVLTDGGVYDNLGLETAFKRHTTLLVSDGGMRMGPEREPHGDWAQHSKRILDLVDNQVRSLRKRQLIQAYVKKDRDGAYWAATTNLEDYGKDAQGAVYDPFGYLAPDRPSWKDTADLAATPTRLAAMEPYRQKALINWGYAVCDAALHAHAIADLKDGYGIDVAPAAGLPYPDPFKET